MSEISQLACHECDLIVEIPRLRDGQKATCPRCDFVFTRFHKNGKSQLFALSITSLIFMILTLMFPFLIFTSQGNAKTISFIESLQSMGDETYLFVVVFLIATTILIPAAVLVGINYVLLSTKMSKPLPYIKWVLRTVFHLQPWNMSEIFLLGILVSMVKIATLAHVEFGWSFFAFVFFVICMAATRQTLDNYQIWQWLNEKETSVNDRG